MDRRGPDAGATPVLAMLILAFVMLVAGSVAVLYLGGATSERREAQSAADAAGLAAMDAVADRWRQVLLDGFDSEHQLRLDLLSAARPCAGSSLANAQSFANKNDAVLTDCTWQPALGRVSVAVRSTDSKVSDSTTARARASAALTLDLRSCTLGGDVSLPPEPTPTPTPPPDDDDPTPTPEPEPEPVEGVLRCGSTTFRVERAGPDDPIRITPPGQVRQDLTEPILTS